MPATQWYIKFETLKNGTNPIYLTSGTISGLAASADVLTILKTDGLVLTGQSVQTLDGTNTYPTLTFDVIDEKKGFRNTDTGTGASSDTGEATNLFYTYKAYIYSSRVSFYEGDSGTAYASFTKRFSGYVSVLTRVMGGYTIEIQSLFKRLENPIVFPTGSFQVATEFDGISPNSITPSAISIKNSVNILPINRTNFITTCLGGGTGVLDQDLWTETTGAATFDNTLKTITASSITSLHVMYREISVGSSAATLKLGVPYTFYEITSLRAGSADSLQDHTYTVKIDGRDFSGNVIDSESVSVRYAPDVLGYTEAKGLNYNGVIYYILDHRITKLRLTLTMDSTASLGTVVLGKVTSPAMTISNTWLMNREIVDILNYYPNAGTYDTATINAGTAYITGRGGLGTLPSRHEANEEALKITIWGGHPIDIARRGILSSSTAGGNGKYDPGDGLGLGAEFVQGDINGTNLDAVKDYIKTGELYPPYDPNRTYYIKEVVSYNGKNYVSIRSDHHSNPPDGVQSLSYIDEDEAPVPSDPIPFASSTDNTTTQWRAAWSAARQAEEEAEDTPLMSVTRSSGSTTSSSKYWMEIGNYFDGENFRHYKMMFFFSNKIENYAAWLNESIWKPIHANMFENSTAQIDARIYHGIEQSGANVLTADHRKFGGEIEQTIDRNYVYNKVVYRLDFDTFGALDIQGNQDGNSSTFAREWQLSETEMGNESATATSLAKFGLREYVIEAQGVRGAHSARFGLCYELWGDQIAWEVARRIITRYGAPITTYQWNGMFSKRNLDVTEVVSVTHANMLDFDNGKWGRSNAPMAILDKEVNYAAGSSDCMFTLRADSDVSAITNTTVAAFPVIRPLPMYSPSHLYTGFPEVGTGTTGEIYRDLPIYPKGYARIVTLRISYVNATTYSVGDVVSENGVLYYCIQAGAGKINTTTHVADAAYWTAFNTTFSPLAKLLVYRYSYPSNITSSDDPESSSHVKIQLVGEFDNDATDFYFLVAAASSVSACFQWRFQIVNQDREPGPISTKSTAYLINATMTTYGRRGGKSEIRQVDSSGARMTWTGTGGGYTSSGR